MMRKEFFSVYTEAGLPFTFVGRAVLVMLSFLKKSQHYSTCETLFLFTCSDNKKDVHYVLKQFSLLYNIATLPSVYSMYQL